MHAPTNSVPLPISEDAAVRRARRHLRRTASGCTLHKLAEHKAPRWELRCGTDQLPIHRFNSVGPWARGLGILKPWEHVQSDACLDVGEVY